MAFTDDEKKAAEQAKLAHDYYKHLTTLSTGSILLVATITDKFESSSGVPSLCVWAIAGFLVSVVSSVMVQTYALETMYGGFPGRLTRFVTLMATLCAWIGFVVGIVFVAMIAIAKLFSNR